MTGGPLLTQLTALLKWRHMHWNIALTPLCSDQRVGRHSPPPPLQLADAQHNSQTVGHYVSSVETSCD